MATNFPGTAIDSFPTHATGDVIQASYDNNEQDAIVALETKVGINNSAVTTTFDYKLSLITGTNQALPNVSPSITTPTILLGSHATGDIYYDGGSGLLTRLGIGSTNNVLTVIGGLPSWVAPAAVVNASSSVAGIVQIATAAQITAGTATGSTGAVIAISPDQLALATPAFNAFSLTNVFFRRKIQTSFETSARFSTLASGGTNTFGTLGLAMDTTSTTTRCAGVTMYVGGVVAQTSIFKGSPSFSAQIDTSTIGSGGSMFIGIGSVTVAGSGHTFTVAHIGFKCTIAANVMTFVGTNASGGVESTTATLFTLDNGAASSAAIYFKVNGNSSVDYYWFKDGTGWSAATNLATNVPTVTEVNIQASLSNNSTASQTAVSIASMEYTR